jgi:D-beta-D-heptose 7-phosphate kinase/D-beta-D-heptose 1-phosphate adenosyltransferase
VYGESKRLSPEAPVPVFIPKYTTINNGMCGNVMENLKGLVPDADVNYVPQQTKITKTRYVDDKSNYMFLRVDDGEGDVSSLKLNGYIRKLIEKSDITIVSDYNKGFLTDDVLVEIGQLSKLSIIDSKRNLTDSVVESYTFIKLNEEEFSVNKKLSEKYLNKMVVTLGMKGAMYNNVNYPSPSPKQTIDVSGAGDTFVASFITKIYETDDISDSIKFANEMASIVVSKRGVATPF